MMITRSAWQVNQLDPGPGDFRLALFVWEFENGIGIGNVKRVARECHSERRVQPFKEDFPLLRSVNLPADLRAQPENRLGDICAPPVSERVPLAICPFRSYD